LRDIKTLHKLTIIIISYQNKKYLQSGQYDKEATLNDWIVMANKGECVIFEKVREGYVKLQTLGDQRLRQRESDLYSDRSGTAHTSFRSNQTRISEEHYPEELARKFANKITDYLDKNRHLGTFDKLTLVSGPSFVGYIRDAMSRPLQQKVGGEIVRNFLTQNEKELDSFLKIHQ